MTAQPHPLVSSVIDAVLHARAHDLTKCAPARTAAARTV